MNNERVRQRVARLLLWLLGGRQTRDQYRQSARYQSDGVERGAQDPDSTRRYLMQQWESYERQERQKGWGRGR